MKKCVACNFTFDNSSWVCPTCGHQPDKVDGFVSFDAVLGNANKYFKTEKLQELYEIEDKHFWYVKRNELIIKMIKKYRPVFTKFMEIGCGNGFVISEIIKSFPERIYVGSDVFFSGLQCARTRVSCSLIQMNALNIPYVEEYELIGMFDVLEHIEDDERVLSETKQALTKNGMLIATVPQHSFLWSDKDVQDCHIRRYSARELVEKFEKNGYKVIYKSSFVCFLMPIMFFSRFGKYNSKKELQINPLINCLFKKIMGFENFLISKGCTFPFGGSLLIVAEKTDSV